jgi:hypothetical protein
VAGAFICSLCCGESRTGEKCGGCSFAKPASATRNYRNVPYYTTQEMADTIESVSLVVESTLCRIWKNNPHIVNDRTASRLVELLIDKYHFNDDAPPRESPEVEEGFHLLLRNIEKRLPQTSSEELVKVLGAVYRSIARRSDGTSYLQFISEMILIGPGL